MKKLIFLFSLLLATYSAKLQNTSITLDGQSEFLSVAHKDNQNIVDQFTVEAWIFANAWTTEIWRGSIVAKDNQGPDRGFAFRCGDNGKLSFVIAMDNSWNETFSTSLMNVGQWHHVAGTYDNGQVKIFIDGQEVASNTFSGTPSPLLNSDLLIGASNFDGRFFNGALDELRIWSVARTQQQIADNSTLDLPSDTPGLELYFPMNDGEGINATNIVDIACSATGLGIDDSNWTEGYSLPDYDLALQSISGIDMINVKTRPIRLIAKVQNVGTNDILNYDLKVTVNGNELFTENVVIGLDAGESADYMLKTPIDLTDNNSPEIEIEAIHQDDSNGLNNLGSINFVNPQGNRVILFNGETHNFGGAGQNQFAQAVLPGDLSNYDRILLHISLTCPSGGCDPWDQPAKLVANTSQGNFEIARYITPYGISCGPWTLDITDFKSALQGSVEYNSFIQVWGQSGWNATIEMEFVDGDNPHPYSKIHTLWADDYIVYGDPGISHDLPIVNVGVDPNTEVSHSRMQVTGHGQGNTFNAAEFYEVDHDFVVNGNIENEHNLWKDDCNVNSCANQAGNWLFARAGWCPGQEVIPYVINTTSAASPGSNVTFDYELQDYTNLLNTGYNNSGHTEPHYRIHGFFVEESSNRFVDYVNLRADEVFADATGSEISPVSMTVTNNGSVEVSSFKLRYFINNELVSEENITTTNLDPGQSFIHEFAIVGNIIGGENVIFGEVEFEGDQNPGDNLVMTSVFGTSSTIDLSLNDFFSILPNPSNGLVKVQLDENLLGSRLEIFSMTGQKILSLDATKQNHSFELDQAGSYILRCTTQEGFYSSKKIVVIE